MAQNATELTLVLRAKDAMTKHLKAIKSHLGTITSAAKKTGSVINQAFKSVGGAVFNLKNALIGLAGSAGIGLVAKGFIDTADELERYEGTLATVTRSTERAQQMMRNLNKFAAETPFEIPQLVEAATRLESYQLNSEKFLKGLGDAAAGLNKPLIAAVEAVADASQGEFERMKEFGLRALDIAKKAGFKTVQEMNSSRENLAKGTEAIMEIFKERFSGGMRTLSKTFSGMTSNLSDQWTQFQKAVMDSGPFEILKGFLRDVLVEIDKMKKDGRFDKWAAETGKVFLDMIQVMISGFQQFLTALEFIFVGFQKLKKLAANFGEIISISVGYWANTFNKALGSVGVNLEWLATVEEEARINALAFNEAAEHIDEDAANGVAKLADAVGNLGKRLEKTIQAEKDAVLAVGQLRDAHVQEYLAATQMANAHVREFEAQKKLVKSTVDYAESLEKVEAAELKALEAQQKATAESLKLVKERSSAIKQILDVDASLKNFEEALAEKGLTREEKDVNELIRQQERFSEVILQGKNAEKDARRQLRDMGVSEEQREAVLETIRKRQATQQVEALREISNKTKELALAAEQGSLQESNARKLVLESSEKLKKAMGELAIIQGTLDKATLKNSKTLESAYLKSLHQVDQLQTRFDELAKQIKVIESKIVLTEQAKVLAQADQLRRSLVSRFANPIMQKVIVESADSVSKVTRSSGLSVNRESGGIFLSDAPKFASGIRSVPRDNFPAILHKGERVLTRSETKERDGQRVTVSIGDIHVHAADSSEAPELLAERIYDELDRIKYLRGDN